MPRTELCSGAGSRAEITPKEKLRFPTGQEIAQQWAFYNNDLIP